MMAEHTFQLVENFEVVHQFVHLLAPITPRKNCASGPPSWADPLDVGCVADVAGKFDLQ